MELEETLVKATGIIRKIDDLGRVVIPKEIRRTLRIREGDPLEIYRDLERMIDRRESVVASGAGKEYRKVCDEPENFAWEVICPIISGGDAIGAVVIFTRSKEVSLGDTEHKLARVAAGFLGRQLEQ